MAADQNLRHEEIWDDTELVDSWNEAVEEYKYYHSLHARGEKVEDVLRQVDQTNDRRDGLGEESLIHEANADGEALHVDQLEEIGEIDENDDQPMIDAEVDNASIGLGNHQRLNVSTAKDASDARKQAGAASAAPPIGPSVPQTLLAGQDEALKGLMMSWYYAGYYTGLYEGQQKAKVGYKTGGG